jgi:hypothetical protein
MAAYLNVIHIFLFDEEIKSIHSFTQQG